MDTNLFTLIEKFRNEDGCRVELERLRWPDGITCHKCGGKTISRIYERKQLHCESCNHQFSITAGTIFHDSHLPLTKWFMAVYLMCEAKKSVSALQLKRTLGVSYKTAWYLCHRIRAAMANGNGQGHKLTGEVEIDETYVGGKSHGIRGRGAKGKTAVVGLVERGGELRWSAVPDVSRATILNLVREHVSPQALAIYTDEFPAYKKLKKGFPTVKHRRVCHSQSWVHGKVHTNTVEGVWSLLKRSIVGSYHKVSVKHLPAYLEEIAWRYNNRRNLRLFQLTLQRLIENPAVTFSALTNNR